MRGRIIGLATVAVVSAGAVACSPTPEPTPTPTAAFASEEEAFAAAEETYRAYTEALNAVDTRDPMTFEPLYEYATGEFERSDREVFSMMYAEEYVIAGETRLLSFEGTEAKAPFETVIAQICLDVSTTTVTDTAGKSQVDPNRPDTYALSVVFTEDDSRLLIESADRIEDSNCAS